MDQEHLERFVAVEKLAAGNKRRIEKLEKESEALTQIANSVAVMANEQKNISEKLDSVDSKVDELEHKPARRWESVVDKALTTFLAALVTWLLVRLGIA